MARNNLFELIKTMTSGEKRAFKLFAQRYSKKVNVYVKLFEVIDKLDAYDIAYIRSKYIVPYKLEKQFPVIKNKLFHIILSSLRNQYQEKYTPFRVSRYFDEADILMNRGLIKAALSSLEKAEKCCKDSDNLLILLKILDRKTDVYRRILKAEAFKEKVHEIIEQKTAIRNSILKEYQLEQIYNDIFYLFRTGGTAETEEKLAEFHRIMAIYEKEIDKESMTIKSKHFEFLLHTIYYYCIKKMDESVKSALEHVDFLEEHPVFLEENINEYLKALNNSITIYIAQEKYDDANKVLEKVEALRYRSIVLNRFIEQRIFEIKYGSKLGICVNSKNIKEGLKLVPDIEKGVNKYKNAGLSIDRNVRFSFGLALLYFWKREWNACLDWTNKIEKIDQEASGGPAFVVGYAKLLAILCHYELGNEAFTESLLQSTRRFLIKNKRLFEPENLILKYLKRMLFIIESERFELMESFKRDLVLAQKKDADNIVFTTIGILDWLNLA